MQRFFSRPHSITSATSEGAASEIEQKLTFIKHRQKALKRFIVQLETNGTGDLNDPETPELQNYRNMLYRLNSEKEYLLHMLETNSVRFRN